MKIEYVVVLIVYIILQLMCDNILMLKSCCVFNSILAIVAIANEEKLLKIITKMRREK